MKAVTETIHLQKRGKTWYYSRRVPTALTPILGRAFIKQSLGTSDLTTARKLRNIKNVEFDAQCEMAAKCSTPSAFATSSEHNPISLETLIDYVRTYVADLEEKSAACLSSAISKSSQEQINEMKIDTEMELQFLRERDDHRGQEWVYKAVNDILGKAGAHIDDGETDRRFSEIVRRALIELTLRDYDRLNDRYGLRYHDPLFDPDRLSGITFGALADVYWTELSERYQQNDVAPKRLDEMGSRLAFVREAIGEDLPINAIDDDLIQNLRGILARLPKHRKKIYPGLSIDEAVTRASQDGVASLGPVSQGYYLDCLRDVLKVAVRKGYLRRNPAEGVKPLKKDKLQASDKRRPWNSDQVIGFFTGEFYHSCMLQASVPYREPDRAWRFWLPLMMLFGGFRPKEVAQLSLGDIKQTKSGTWFVDLVAADSGDPETRKTLKTRSSRRRVPLHSELVKLGLLEFVAKRRKNNKKTDQRLFFELKRDKYGNPATYACRRLRETFIHAEVELFERQSLYSLRHTVRDAFRRVDATDDVLRAVMGWEEGKSKVSDDYGDPKNPDLYAKWVEKISYPGLDLTFLHGAGALV